VLRERYVDTARLIRRRLDGSAVGRRLSSSQSKSGRHVQSLLAIYDLDAMVELDTPWWTYRAIAEVEDFLRTKPDSAATVFEYGSGASTHWLASRSACVYSTEHDAEWAKQLEPRLKMENVELTCVPPKESSSPTIASRRKGNSGLDYTDYVNAIDAVEGDLDLIVIDGRVRTACLSASINRLAPDGVIVFDNAGRLRYRKAIRSSGLKVRRLYGLAPSLPYPSCTALLTKK